MNEERDLDRQDWDSKTSDVEPKKNSLETKIGAAGGAIAGAAVGGKLGGKTGAALGAIAGAVVGGVVGNEFGDDLEELERQAMETLGEAPGEGEILPHYSWDELQALSKPKN